MSVFFALHVHDDFLMYICYRHAGRNVVCYINTFPESCEPGN